MRRDHLIILGIGALFFIPFLGSVHLFDWDEINFAECAREMIRTGNYMRPQIDYEPFWEKPPLFLWMQALSMQLFGVNEFAARLPNALCGILTLLIVYEIGRKLYDRDFAWIWVLMWLGSFLPHLYFRSGIIDPWFNLFIFTGLYGFIEFRWRFFTIQKGKSFWLKYRHILLGGWLLGMAILTKGPTAFLIVMLVLLLYWARYRFKNRGFFTHLVIYSLAAASVSLVWFGAELLLHGPWFIQEFVMYQIRLFVTEDSGHGGFWGYHVIVLLLGAFPASVFAIPNLWNYKETEDEMLESNTLQACTRFDLTTWMQLLFWVVLILFSIVRTKIVHYSSLAYFPLTFLGTLTVWRAVRWQLKPRIVSILLPVVGLLLGGAVTALPWLGQHLEIIRPLFSADPFALANLEAEVEWSLWQGLPGIALIAGASAGWWFWMKGKSMQSAQALLTGGVLFSSFTLLFIACNIEGYSQRAAIEFYESKAHEDCFIKPVGYKSYAHLFYSDKRPVGPDPAIDDMPQLVQGHPGKKVYLVAKITNPADAEHFPGCRELFRKNGFIFYEKKEGN